LGALEVAGRRPLLALLLQAGVGVAGEVAPRMVLAPVDVLGWEWPLLVKVGLEGSGCHLMLVLQGQIEGQGQRQVHGAVYRDLAGLLLGEHAEVKWERGEGHLRMPPQRRMVKVSVDMEGAMAVGAGVGHRLMVGSFLLPTVAHRRAVGVGHRHMDLEAGMGRILVWVKCHLLRTWRAQRSIVSRTDLDMEEHFVH